MVPLFIVELMPNSAAEGVTWLKTWFVAEETEGVAGLEYVRDQDDLGLSGSDVGVDV